MSTQIKRLYQNSKEFVPITLSEAVVVNTESLPILKNSSIEKITTLDRVLRYTLTYLETTSGSVQQFQNTVDAINAALVKKQDKLTAGYGINISDDGTISVTLGIKLHKIVQELPSASIDCIDTIYLVPSSNVAGNSFTEYICIQENNAYKWEEIGTIQTNVDLTGYVTKDEFNEALVDVITAEDVKISNGTAKVVVNYNIPPTLYDSLVNINDGDEIISE